VAIATAVLMLQWKKYNYFLISACSICLIFVIHFFNAYQQSKVRELTVYRLPGYSAIDLISHGRAIFVADTALYAASPKTNFHITPNRVAKGASVVLLPESSYHRTIPGAKIYQWQHKRILLVESDEFIPIQSEFDVVVIANNAVKDITNFTARISCAHLILDSSNSYYYANKVLAEKKSGVKVHSVLHDGAFQIILGDES
jgi:competence protein ComEC